MLIDDPLCLRREAERCRRIADMIGRGPDADRLRLEALEHEMRADRIVRHRSNAKIATQRLRATRGVRPVVSVVGFPEIAQG